MIYRALLDNIVMDEPKGWDDVVSTLKRDYSLRGIVFTQDGQFVFQGDGYQYLHDLALNSSGTARVDLRVDRSDDDGGTFIEDYKGTIFVSDCEFNELTEEAKCKVQDDSYYARINNNKKIGAFLYGELSKNNVAITPCTLYSIQYFTVTTGAYITQTFNGGYEGAAFKAFDVLRYMIEWMTDDNVGFSSSVFDAGGDYEHYYVTHGRAIQLADQSVPSSVPCDLPTWQANWNKVNWETVFKEFSNRFNLWWTIDYSTGSPVFVLEKESYFRSGDVIYRTSDINSIITKINTSLLYGNIKFKQGEDLFDLSTHFPSIGFLGSKEEEFQIIGESNVDATLNLTCEWTHDSNVIEYLLHNGVASDEHYDKMIFIVECTPDVGSNVLAVKENQIDSSGYSYYNQSLMNNQISQRFLGGVPQSIATYISPIDCTVSASGTLADNTSGGAVYTYVPPLDYTHIVFPTEISDPSAVYNNTVSRFIAPRDGSFSFKTILSWAKFFPLGCYLELQRYDSGYTTLLGRTKIGNLRYGQLGFPAIVEEYSGTINALAGEVIILALSNETTAFTGACYFSGTSYFYCTGSSTTGGEYQYYNPEDFPAFLHDFTEYPVTHPDFKNIIASSGGICEFAMNGQQLRNGWFDLIKYKPSTGKATFQLSSTKRIN